MRIWVVFIGKLTNKRWMRTACSSAACALLYLLAGSVHAIQGQGQAIAPPTINFVDEYDVDVRSREPVIIQPTVSIGGELGISHSISLYTGDIALENQLYTYKDQFTGNATYLDLGKYSGSQERLGVMRVFGPVGSQDFRVVINGQARNYVGPGHNTGYSYEPLTDGRHDLAVIDSQGSLLWTTADGTRLLFKRNASGTHATSRRELTQIAYPNGYTIDISRGSAVSNTGYLIKYQFNSNDSRRLSSHKQAILNSLPSGHLVPPASPSGYASVNPERVKAINLAYEYCSSDRSQPCDNLSYDWPAATFSWPGGMPSAIFLGKTVLEVIDAAGRKTEFHYEAHDVMLIRDGSYAGRMTNGSYFPHAPNERWSPRLTGVKFPGSKQLNREYVYENVFDTSGSNIKYTFAFMEHVNFSGDQSDEVPYSYDPSIPTKFMTTRGHVKTASGDKGRVSYRMDEGQGGTVVMKAAWYYGAYQAHLSSSTPGAINRFVSPKAGDYLYSGGFTNRINKKRIAGIPAGVGPAESYEHDVRGNIIKIERPQGSVTADYPSECNSSNRKYCNKPKWVKDARGNRTDYEYHSQSGQVAAVIQPADSNGVRPTTRYEYDQFNAAYKRNGSRIEQDNRAVWLPTRKIFCKASRLIGSNCSEGDQIEVVYEYGGIPGSSANNLNLTSETVTYGAGSSAQSRATCYQYDVYGNRIGERQTTARCQ